MRRSIVAWALVLVAMWMISHPRGSEASEQVAPDAQPFAVVTLELVRGLEDVQRARQPLGHNLESAAPAGLETGALPDGAWRFGVIPLPRNDYIDFAVSPDRKELFFDADRDARLEPDERYRFNRIEGPNVWFDFDALVRTPVDEGAQELPVPVSLSFAREPADGVLYRVNAFPSSVLVAQDGTIAAKNLRGERLASEFKEAMLAWEDRQVAAGRGPSGQ